MKEPSVKTKTVILVSMVTLVAATCTLWLGYERGSRSAVSNMIPVSSLELSMESSRHPVPRSPPEWTSEKIIRIARADFERGQFEEAERKLNLLLEIAPESRAARYYLKLIRDCRVAQSNRVRQNRDGLWYPMIPPRPVN